MRHKLLIGAAVLALAAGAGGAYAATQSSSNPRQAYLNDVAKRLGVSPSKLRAALRGAFLDRLNADVKAGRLTQAEADRIKRRIEQGRGFPLGPPRRFGFEPRGHRGPFSAAAQYLGVSEPQLLSELRGGRTLAEVAKAHGKSVSGLEQALIGRAKSRLARGVAAGVITAAQAQRIESRLAQRIDRLVNQGLPRFGPRFAPPPPPPGGPSLGGPLAAPPPAA